LKIDPWLTFQVVAGSFGANTESVPTVPIVSLASTTSALLIQGLSHPGPAGTGAQSGELAVVSLGSAATNTFTLDGENVAVSAPARFSLDTLIGFSSGNRMASMQIYDAVAQRWRRLA
jgi:hypothetical protein